MFGRDRINPHPNPSPLERSWGEGELSIFLDPEGPMELPGDHKSFLDRRDFVIPPGDFTPAERTLLAKYGRWLEALASGTLLPLTPTQEEFIRVARDQAEPSTDFEHAWMKAAHQRAIAPEVVWTFKALAEARAAAASLEAEYREARSAVLSQIRDQLAAVDAAYAERLRDAADAAATNEEMLRALIQRHKHSVTLAGVRAVYSAGRVTWDSKKMEVYAQAHPEVREFRKVGNPVVSLRFLDQLTLPEQAKPPAMSNEPSSQGELERGNVESRFDEPEA
jgi:uncharacterized protein YifE (UPF0438 family)